MSKDYKTISFKKKDYAKEDRSLSSLKEINTILKDKIVDSQSFLTTIPTGNEQNYPFDSIKSSQIGQQIGYSIKSSKIADERLDMSVYYRNRNDSPFRVLESRKQDKLQTQFNIKSYQDQIRTKVATIQQETYRLVQIKEKQIQLLHRQIQKYKEEIKQYELQINSKNLELDRLKKQKPFLINNNKTNNYDKVSYERNISISKSDQFNSLKKIIDNLSRQKQQLKTALNNEISANTKLAQMLTTHRNNPKSKRQLKNDQKHWNQQIMNNQILKKEVKQLSNMIIKMQTEIESCPSCFSLIRQNQQLLNRCNFMQKQISELRKTKKLQQTNLLNDITIKICQNQNIIRQNLQIKNNQKRELYFSGMRRKQKHSSKIKDEVVKRCRTLTQSC